MHATESRPRSSFSRREWHGAILVISCALTGCGATGPEEDVVSISGRITVDGAPAYGWIVEVGSHRLSPSGYGILIDPEEYHPGRTLPDGTYVFEASVALERCPYVWVFVRSPHPTLLFDELRLPGCGTQAGVDFDLQAELMDVSGTVTFGGLPAAGALVWFETFTEFAPRRPMVGTVADADGTYRLRTLVPSALCQVQVGSHYGEPWRTMSTLSMGCDERIYTRDINFTP